MFSLDCCFIFDSITSEDKNVFSFNKYPFILANITTYTLTYWNILKESSHVHGGVDRLLFHSVLH